MQHSRANELSSSVFKQGSLQTAEEYNGGIPHQVGSNHFRFRSCEALDSLSGNVININQKITGQIRLESKVSRAAWVWFCIVQVK